MNNLVISLIPGAVIVLVAAGSVFYWRCVFHLSLKIGEISTWWVELAFLPMTLISIPILRWCYVKWGKEVPARRTSSPAAG
jgi:hypothetical protein